VLSPAEHHKNFTSLVENYLEPLVYSNTFAEEISEAHSDK